MMNRVLVKILKLISQYNILCSFLSMYLQFFPFHQQIYMTYTHFDKSSTRNKGHLTVMGECRNRLH
jgi:hypothetical protein